MGRDRNGKELGEGIRQRKDGSYEARYRDRLGCRRSIYHKDLRVLKKKLIQTDIQDDPPIEVSTTDVTLDQWYDQWMLAYKRETVRANTITHYNQIYRKHIAPVFGDCKLKEITHIQIQMFINDLKKQGLGWETQNKCRVMLVDMFNHAMIDDLITKSPAIGIRIASPKPNKDRKILTSDEQALFLECSAGTS